MEPRQVRNARDARAIVEERKLTHIKVGVFDVDGMLRGKYISQAKFLSALEKGFGFCDVVLGWDSNDQLYDNVTYTGLAHGLPRRQRAQCCPTTCRALPVGGRRTVLPVRVRPPAEASVRGASCVACSSGRVRSGFEPYVGFEYEFFVFNETPESVRAKNYRDLQPLAPGFFGYSVLRNSVHSDFYRQLLDTCEAMDFGIEGLHEETGAGVMEAAITFDGAEAAADKAALFKTFSKVMAQRQNQHGHLHGEVVEGLARAERSHPHVAQGRKARACSTTPSKPHTMSQAHAALRRRPAEAPARAARDGRADREFLPRLIPGFWAPTDATWGIENRTCALRVIPGSEKAQRVEFRIAAADANPYIALAAALAAGLHGIGAEDRAGQARSRATPTHKKFPKHMACRRRCGMRRSGSRPRRWRATGLAMRSSTITPRRANGKSASSASTSPTGNSRGTSRSSSARFGGNGAVSGRSFRNAVNTSL